MTPSGQMNTALQSIFRKAQMTEAALETADNVSRMELEISAEHNREIAELVCCYRLATRKSCVCGGCEMHAGAVPCSKLKACRP
jgi:hypothetical protein